MIEDPIPQDALGRLSLQEYGDDWEWLEAVRTVTRAEEDFRERKSLRGGGPSGMTRAEKRRIRGFEANGQRKACKKAVPG